jgi:hypothetical protein
MKTKNNKYYQKQIELRKNSIKIDSTILDSLVKIDTFLKSIKK